MGSPEDHDIHWNFEAFGDPPFSRVNLDHPKCKICGGMFCSRFGWGFDGWMCGVHECITCGGNHIITDSEKFCNSCASKNATCLCYPQIFVRGEG